MLQILVSGLAMGGIYALVALGFVLIHNASGAVNFAQGDLVMIGGFIGVWAATRLPLPAVLRAGVAGLLVVGVGYVFQFVAYRPLRNRPGVTVFISTIGIGIAMRSGALLIWGPEPSSLPPFVGGVAHVGSLVIAPQYLITTVAAMVLLVGLNLFLNGTQVGRMMRATAQDQEVARLVGVRVHRVVNLTFTLSALLAALAGFMLAPIFFLTPSMGNLLILKAFTAVVVGGFGSIYGAALGGVLLGVVEAGTAGLISTAYKDVITFAILIVFLFVRPQGILGETVAEKV